MHGQVRGVPRLSPPCAGAAPAGRAAGLVVAAACLAAMSALARPAPAEPPAAADLSTRPGEDWGTFLGPRGDGTSALRGIEVPWPADGPRVVWHAALGEGYCAPAVAAGRAILFDRVGDRLRLRAVAAETGAPLWEVDRAVRYVDSFGYDGGPRAQPVVTGNRLLAYGPDGRLECRALADGALVWGVDTAERYHVVQNFFGVGTAPLLAAAGGRSVVVVQVGGSAAGTRPPSPERLDMVRGVDSGLVAFDLADGSEVWRSSDQLASYSVPVKASIGGRDRILAWMRDELISVDPADGRVMDAFRWRSPELFSVVAASPVVVGERVLLTECYGPGSVLLDAAGDRFREVRRDRPGARSRQALKAHWNTPVHHEGHVYGSSGRNAGDAQLVCVDVETGAVRWSEGGLGRASVTLVDGHLLVLGEYGDLVLARATPEGYQEVARGRPADPDSGRALLEAPCWAAPVVARGLLFLRGEGRVVCLDLLPGG
ncbi:MAG: PQQ-binding-like beta-propeller repeat protein [Planctomycetaceae bacterium]